MSPAEKEARRMMAEKKLDEANEKAFNKAAKTPPSEDPRDAVRGQKGYASGGKVGSASKRADGCATQGKTKGTMVKMAMGGKTC
jgi:hypothetical protein